MRNFAVVTTREYQLKAAAAVLAAEDMHDPEERVELLQLAQGYLTLAKYAERRQDSDASSIDDPSAA